MKMAKSLFMSVVVPVYNSSRTVKLCIEAVFNQDYENYEVIVIDDCSSDSSVEIKKNLKKKKNKFRFIQLKENKGPAYVRNLGAKKGLGDIIVYADSDLAMHEDCLKLFNKKFLENPDIASVAGIYSKKPLIKTNSIQNYKLLQEHFWRFSSPQYISSVWVSLGAIKRDMFKQFQGFNEKYKKADVEDVEFGNKIAKKYKIFKDNSIQGDHDSDYLITTILLKTFKRSSQLVRIFLTNRGFENNYATSNRTFACIFAFLALISLFLIFANFFYIPLLFLLLFFIFDLNFYKFLYREVHFPTVIIYLFFHFILNITIFLGIVFGFIKEILK